ncbi:hypothetical protein [Prevotella sp.]
MQYDKEIIRVLVEAGEEGLSVWKISHHVYNACNSLFHPIIQDDVRKYVQGYLLKNSKLPSSLIERVRKGIYRLNASNSFSQQFILQFRDEKEDSTIEKPTKDLSLSLF